MKHSKQSLVHGVGEFDGDRATFTVIVDGKPQRQRDPFYAKWSKMLLRVYCPLYLAKRPSYEGVSVTPDWHKFSSFKSWMLSQDWDGKHLDKDLLFPGNKHYSPTTCCFLSPGLNSFLTEAKRNGGHLPTGVSWDKHRHKYAACISRQGKTLKLGRFDDPIEAHNTWLDAKITEADRLADLEPDPRIAEALRRYYRNYLDPWIEDQNLPLAA